MEDIDRDRFMTPAEARRVRARSTRSSPPPAPAARRSSIGAMEPSGIHHLGVAVADLDEAVGHVRAALRRRARAPRGGARPGRRGGVRARRRQPGRAARGRSATTRPSAGSSPSAAPACTTSPTRSTTSQAALDELAAGGVELIDARPRRGPLRPAGCLCPPRRRPRRPHGGRLRWLARERVRIEIAFDGGQIIAANVSTRRRRRARACARRRPRGTHSARHRRRPQRRSCSRGSPT